jgi:hypothetical protein
MPEAFRELAGSQHFYQMLWGAAITHHSKNQDYATKEDPFKNFRVGEPLGIPAYRMALLRILEKVARVTNLEAKTDVPATAESVEDTLLDIAVLALITITLRQE